METDPFSKTSAKILDVSVYKLVSRDRKCPNVGSATDCSVRNDSLFRNLKAAIKSILSIEICFNILLSENAFLPANFKKLNNRMRTGIIFRDK